MSWKQLIKLDSPWNIFLRQKKSRKFFYHKFRSLLWLRNEKLANKVKKVPFDNYKKNSKKSGAESFYVQDDGLRKYGKGGLDKMEFWWK